MQTQIHHSCKDAAVIGTARNTKECSHTMAILPLGKGLNLGGGGSLQPSAILGQGPS